MKFSPTQVALLLLISIAPAQAEDGRTLELRVAQNVQSTLTAPNQTKMTLVLSFLAFLWQIGNHIDKITPAFG